MRWLEHRVPPPLLVVLDGWLMWWLSKFGMTLPVEAWLRIGLAGVCVSAGLFTLFSGLRGFRRARTTVNPLRPDAASLLVVDGIYRFSRNPMYLGFALLLLGWGCYLAAGWALIGPVAFILFITHFQIIPEERALNAKFGDAFVSYCSRVRRWL